MADNSTIEWTDTTWNPIAGCSIVSPGCTNCYAMRRVAPRLSGNPATPHYHGTVKPSKAGRVPASGLPLKGGTKYVWTGKIGIASDEVLTKPLRWKRGRRIFGNSTSDLFHEGVPDEVIDKVFAVMALTPQHTYQWLTKRAERMRDYLGCIQDNPPRRTHIMALASRMMKTDDPRQREGAPYFPLPNVWLGVSVEDQTSADERIPHLLATPAAVRFISAEPLIGPVDLMKVSPNGIQSINSLNGRSKTPDVDFKARLDWVIVGGESGNGARPMHPDWARSIRDQCASADVPFFFKQWGEWLPWEPDQGPCWKSQTREIEDAHILFPDDFDNDPKWDDGLWAIPEKTSPVFQNVGKPAAGRLLDGVEHNGVPASGLASLGGAESGIPERHT